MGWCSGTPIFDTVCEEVLKLDVSKVVKERILTKLIDAMHDHDWDCEGDSEYADDPFVGKLLGIDNDDYEASEAAIEDAVVCFTGFRDDDLASFLVEAGATVASSLTKDVTHLLVGKKSLDKGSTKMGKAIKQGAWVGTVISFLDMFELDYEYEEE